MTRKSIVRALLAATLLAPAVTLPAGGRAPATTCALQISGPAELLAPDIASTPNGEVRPALSPDGQTLLWGSTDRGGGPGGWDIWMSRRFGEAPKGWSEATPVSFNTGVKDFDPAFDASGRWVYFFSNRTGGHGGDDLYRVSFDPATGRFGQAENLGPTINTKGDEWAPTPLAGGRLLFATDGRAGRGRHDLYIGEEKGGRWRGARPLPGSVNTADDEFDATLLQGESILVFSRSADVNEKPIALYSACKGKSGYGDATRLPESVNVADGYTLGPAADPADPDVLLFTGRRPEAQRGKLDLYRIRFRR